ncbi:CPBP family intramembrane metalloprotease [Epidermidibacterium keratini]|uniref:CPBP family intramembrane metalloprotease n=1 Tax=Epidermidibacterium keratini TaxID=1891644 RepID=A0A7L4YNX5_9ACTN|nr:CPBP family intramembrane glutamic endopeptidase [Epidermidibacterium keratini]QHC00846.1 CPBP family intramembrane metalloprotease [Epidermidibacterium keratini]
MTQLALQPALPRRVLSLDSYRTIGVLAGIATINVLAHRAGLPPAAVIPIGAASVATIAVLSGLRPADLGLSRVHWRRGLIWAAGCALAVAASVGLIMAMPGGMALFADARFPSVPPAVFAALVTIPLATVLPEELLFRGVLDGALNRRFGPRTAYAIGALAFGSWHAITSLSLASGNSTVRTLVGNGAFAQVLCTAGVVAVTSVAGFGLSWLRRRSGSLLAPIGLHWALNGIGALAAGVAGASLA